jgi:hypothetical protein
MDSKTNNLHTVEEIFHEALALSGDARAKLIDFRCGGDSDLATQIRSLLIACTREAQRTALLLSEREQGASNSNGSSRWLLRADIYLSI